MKSECLLLFVALLILQIIPGELDLFVCLWIRVAGSLGGHLELELHDLHGLPPLFIHIFLSPAYSVGNNPSFI